MQYIHRLLMSSIAGGNAHDLSQPLIIKDFASLSPGHYHWVITYGFLTVPEGISIDRLENYGFIQR